MISKPLIIELQKIISSEYGVCLSLEKTTELATSLVGYHSKLMELYFENKKDIDEVYQKEVNSNLPT